MKTNKLTIYEQNSHGNNPDMIGLFFEDINFAADGGLYAEMLENRSFEAIITKGSPRNYVLKEDNLYAWSAIDANSELEISMNQSVSENNPHYLRFTSKVPGAGFSNKAYDGLCLKKGMNYKVSFWAKEVEYMKGDIEIRLTKDSKVYGSAKIVFKHTYEETPDWYSVMVGTCKAKEWTKYEAQITATDDVRGAVFELHLTEAGCVEFDVVSMMPEDAVAGVFRKDLFDALANLHPGFLRFPGGCIVEGTSLKFRYQWKNTVGRLEDRKIIPNLWAAQGGNTTLAWEMPDAHYMQSYGIGFYEYFLLCELLSSKERVCKAVPVINIGVACQFRSYETIPSSGEEFDKYVQDALDLIEFANGPVDSKWGALRAQLGHPDSFNLEMLAIGNEQWESDHVDVAPRYMAFEQAIHAKYPDIKCLGTAGPFVKEPLHEKAWNFYREEASKNSKFTYAVDEHYYVAPEWLYDNVDFYDEYPRDVAVFAGEYAGHDVNQSNSVEVAVAEAAMITGMERNGDVVKLASYAPLFNRIGHSHWTPDMIWFDDSQVVLTPSYYVQKLFSDYAGDSAVELKGQEKALRDNKLFVSVVRRGTDTIVKVVNGSKETQELVLNDESGNPIGGKCQVACIMAANGKAKVPERSIACPPDNNHMVPESVVTNTELCKLRGPEEATYSIKDITLAGKIEVPAKSVIAIKYYN